jgi:hypothetical protein
MDVWMQVFQRLGQFLSFRSRRGSARCRYRCRRRHICPPYLPARPSAGDPTIPKRESEHSSSVAFHHDSQVSSPIAAFVINDPPNLKMMK